MQDKYLRHGAEVVGCGTGGLVKARKFARGPWGCPARSQQIRRRLSKIAVNMPTCAPALVAGQVRLQPLGQRGLGK